MLVDQTSVTTSAIEGMHLQTVFEKSIQADVETRVDIQAATVMAFLLLLSSTRKAELVVSVRGAPWGGSVGGPSAGNHPQGAPAGAAGDSSA